MTVENTREEVYFLNLRITMCPFAFLHLNRLMLEAKFGDDPLQPILSSSQNFV